MAELAVLKAAPALALRRETVDVPELGGAVVVRGLTASEAFAITAIRQAATRRVVEEARERRRAAEAAGKPIEDDSADIEALMGYEEWVAYGRYVTRLLALAVQGDGGLSLYSADEWEVCGQHHPGVIQRLQAVAERLSGLIKGDVEKNSSTTPS